MNGAVLSPTKKSKLLLTGKESPPAPQIAMEHSYCRPVANEKVFDAAVHDHMYSSPPVGKTKKQAFNSISRSRTLKALLPIFPPKPVVTDVQE